MASNSGRRSGSSGPSKSRKRVIIGADETVRVRYRHDAPEVESERRGRREPQQADRRSKQKSSSRAGKRLSNAKREQRERRQRSIRFRRSGTVAGIVVVAVLVVWGVVALYRAPILKVESVEVLGSDHYSREDVLRLAQVPPDATLLRVPRRRIEQRLEADPWIESASVSRDFPATLRLEIAERRPIAIVDGGGTQLWVVSDDGYWLGERSSETTSLVSIRNTGEIAPKAGSKIREPQIANAVKVLASLSPQLSKKLASVSAPNVEETALTTKGDVEIFVGEAADMREKDRIAREILKQQKGVVYINVRVTDRPTWRGLGGDLQ